MRSWCFKFRDLPGVDGFTATVADSADNMLYRNGILRKRALLHGSGPTHYDLKLGGSVVFCRFSL